MPSTVGYLQFVVSDRGALSSFRAPRLGRPPLVRAGPHSPRLETAALRVRR